MPKLTPELMAGCPQGSWWDGKILFSALNFPYAKSHEPGNLLFANGLWQIA